MEIHGATRHPSTGRRKITIQELEAEFGSPTTITPPPPLRQVRSAFKAGAHALGLPTAVVQLALYLLGLTREGDWQRRNRDHDMAPIAWPSDEEIRFRFDIRRSRCTELKRALIDFGLARMRRSPNGKRYGKRCAQSGRILYAYGFDLSPLAERVAEFEQAAAELIARRAEGKRLRAEITCLRNQVLGFADLALEHTGLDATQADSETWWTVAAQAQALWAERGDAWDPLVLVPIAARLKVLMLHARERAAAAADAGVGAGDKSPVGPLYRPHQRNAKSAFISEEITTQGRQARPRAHHDDEHDVHRLSQQSASAIPPAERDESRDKSLPGRNNETESALRNFPATPAFVLQIAPAFRDHVLSAKPAWPELVQAAFEVRAGLGISRRTWGNACEVLGRMEATVAVAAIAAKHTQGQVTSPGGYLRAFVTAHHEGRLRLDRTLFGLAERLSFGRQHQSLMPATRRYALDNPSHGLPAPACPRIRNQAR